MITYYLILSQVFPSTHPRAGEPTYFMEKLHNALADADMSPMPYYTPSPDTKLHTIRANYDLWYKRFEKIASGEACLSVRQWLGKPYSKGSKQVEIVRLTREHGIGIQKLNFGWHNSVQIPVIEGWYMYGEFGSKGELAKNDGLGINDWMSWFKAHEVDTVYSKPLAIIHFTHFRY